MRLDEKKREWRTNSPTAPGWRWRVLDMQTILESGMSPTLVDLGSLATWAAAAILLGSFLQVRETSIATSPFTARMSKMYASGCNQYCGRTCHVGQKRHIDACRAVTFSRCVTKSWDFIVCMYVYSQNCTGTARRKCSGHSTEMKWRRTGPLERQRMGLFTLLFVPPLLTSFTYIVYELMKGTVSY